MKKKILDMFNFFHQKYVFQHMNEQKQYSESLTTVSLGNIEGVVSILRS